MSRLPPLLSMRNISRAFPTSRGALSVLRNVNLDVFPGDFIAITGPSGSGKSTLLNIAGLLDTPNEGELCAYGKHIDYDHREKCRNFRKKYVGMVFQQFHLMPHRSVAENVLFGLRYNNVKSGDPAPLLETLGLTKVKDQPARLLSGGEMQRVAIARAMISHPGLLLADEPTGNLDTNSAQLVMDAFSRLIHQGVAILLATHNTALLSFCTRHVTLNSGKLELGEGRPIPPRVDDKVSQKHPAVSSRSPCPKE